MARSIRHEFPTALACHLGGDHFEVLAPREMLIPRLNRINESLNFYLKDSSIALKIGMVVMPEDEEITFRGKDTICLTVLRWQQTA